MGVQHLNLVGFPPQVLVIEQKNEDGVWPRQASHSKSVKKLFLKI